MLPVADKRMSDREYVLLSSGGMQTVDCNTPPYFETKLHYKIKVNSDIHYSAEIAMIKCGGDVLLRL